MPQLKGFRLRDLNALKYDPIFRRIRLDVLRAQIGARRLEANRLSGRWRNEDESFQVQDTGDELAGNIAIEQPVAVLAEHQTRSSAERPTNQRNSRLQSSCSMSYHSERTVLNACSRSARSNRSDRIDGRPSSHKDCREQAAAPAAPRRPTRGSAARDDPPESVSPNALPKKPSDRDLRSASSPRSN
jgi:hypothetical protein